MQVQDSEQSGVEQAPAGQTGERMDAPGRLSRLEGARSLSPRRSHLQVPERRILERR